jgi:hypothetical protein
VQTFALTQTRTRTSRQSQTQPATSLLASLPESDAVALVKVNRLLSDMMPKILANNTTKIAELNASIENFKTRTGLDPRSFDEGSAWLSVHLSERGCHKVNHCRFGKGHV